MERQRKVLVVDDDPFALQSIIKVLEDENYQVVTATSGSEALDLLRRGSFDLVLTDLKMQEVDGLEVLRQAREIAPQAVVLILTGYASVESAVEALREGAYDYLVKPCSSDELRLKIERGLEKVRLAEERQRAEEEIRQRALEQETVSRIAYALNTPDFREAFPVLVEGLQHLTGCDVVSLIALDEAGEQFITTVLESPFPLPGEGDVTPLSATAAAEDIEAGRPHLTADLSTETHFPVEQAFHQAGLRSWVTLPLLVGGEVFGALNLGGSDTGLFREDQLPVLRQIADAVAFTFENSLFFQAEREQRELAEALEEAAATVSSTLDPNQVLDRILEQVSRVVPNDATNVMLIEGDQARVVRWRGYERFGAEEFVSTVVFRIPEVTNLQQMFESREPMVIPDTATYSGWVHVPVQKWLRSYAAAPIVVRGEVIGFLNIDSATPGFFTQAHAEALRAFADHAAAAIENARLYEAECERAETLAALQETALDLAAQRALPDLLRAIAARAVHLLRAKGGSFYLYRPATDDLLLAIDYNVEPDGTGAVLKRGEGLSGKVLETGQPIAVANYSRWEGRSPQFEEAGFTAIVAVPIVWGDRLLGVLDVLDDAPRTFSPADIALLERFTPLVAAALEQERLLEEERARWREAETLRQAITVLSSTLELDEVLELILGQLRQVIPYDSASIQQLLNGGLKIVACQGFEEPDKVVGLLFPLDPGFPNRRVITTKAPLAIGDIVQDYPHFKDEADTYESGRIRSWLGVPLMAKDRVIGMISVDRAEVRPYTAEEVQLAMAFANQAALAIENARLFDETMERAESLSALYEIGKEINATLELDRLLEVICDEAMRTTGVAIAEVSLVDLERGIWEMKAIRGYSENWKGRTFSLDVGITGRVARTGEPAVIPDVKQAEDYLGDARIRSELTVPILSEGKVVGVVNLESTELSAFDEDDLHFLQALADQTAIALKNASLFEEERRRATQLALINEVGEKAASTLDFDKLMQEVTHSIRESFNYYNVAFFLMDEERREMVMQAIAGGFQHISPGEYRQSLDEGIIGFVARTGQSRLVSDVSKDPYYVKGFLGEVLTKSELCVPIKLSDRVIGVLDIQSIHLNAFDQSDVVALEAVVDRSAIAMENARLFEDTERLKAFNESIVQGVAEAILIEDVQGILTFANPAAEELLGYTREELIGRHWKTIVPEEQVEKVQQETAKRPHGIESRYETILLSKEGQSIPVIIGARPLFEEGKFVGVLSAFTDITAQKRMEDMLRALLLIDELTGLYNRRGFVTLSQHQLKAANRAKRRMLLLFADLDGLKQINDAFGHPEGDRALIEVANVLRETFRESDIVARIAGDEFVVLAIETNRVSSEVLTTRLQENLEARNARRDRRYKLSLSVGLARYDPEHPCTIGELLVQADRAMYEKKQSNGVTARRAV